MTTYIHPSALCESESIGNKTRVWAFAHILPNAVIGDECNICDHVFIENDVSIGHRTTVKCGVQVWDGITIEDDVFIGPNVTFTNDPFPRSKHYPDAFSRTLVRRGASIGANATILPGITIGIEAMVGAGAVVTNNVPPYAKVVGNPARIIGYTNTNNTSQNVRKGEKPHASDNTTDLEELIDGVHVYRLPLIKDLRGNLSVGEFESHLPFAPKRYFLVFDVPNSKVRGEHAHKACEQFLICVKGSCCVVVDNGTEREEILLDSPNKGIHLPPMIWGVQYKYSDDAVLLVFASHHYDADDYIRDYDLYLENVDANT